MDEEVCRFWIECVEAVEREWLLAEAFELGAGGAEESEDEERFRACIYVASNRAEGMRSALAEIAPASTRILEAEAPPEVDWSEAWKAGLEALVISPRLVVRPPFVDITLERGQREIVIDPGQAFGTGAHASTHLCLEWMDALMGEAADGARFDRMLDVGTGSGVLALAAIVLGASRALGFDLDPVAIEAAASAARRNGLEAGVSFFAGGIEALAGETSAYPLVVANLLKREMLPIASSIVRSLAPEGRLVLAGLLEEDVAEILDRFAQAGCVEVGRREREDVVGRWVGLCLRPA
ncbi:MAG: methyltransferase domain-containing protein [bacterium]|nr:methyltransferase domain-containing protein [bacterium]